MNQKVNFQTDPCGRALRHRFQVSYAVQPNLFITGRREPQHHSTETAEGYTGSRLVQDTRHGSAELFGEDARKALRFPELMSHEKRELTAVGREAVNYNNPSHRNICG